MGRITTPLDFVDGPLKDFGRTVRYFPVTAVISNIEGDETIEPGPEQELLVVIAQIANSRDDPGREGHFETGDARLYTKPSDNVQHNDLIEWDGRFYRLGIPIRRFASEEENDPMFDHTICHLHEGIPKGPVPGTGRFIGSFRGIPPNASIGDEWFDTEDGQFKGFDDTGVVILG